MEQATELRRGHAQGDIREDIQRYLGTHERHGGSVETRKAQYSEMVRGYYDLVTDIYEKGWGDSFHFAPRFRGEPFAVSLRRHQHFVALRLGLAPGMRALDVGCGVGGPMRELARFSGAHITGINNNAYQLSKARGYNRDARLDELTELLEADFMQIPRSDASFDAIYAFEATCHAPDKTALLRELHRVMKPGAKIAIYEWCLTDRFEASRPEHQRIKHDIEEGNGLPDIWTMAATASCFREAGFSLLEVNDRTFSGDREVPWHLSLSGRELSNTGLRRTAAGKLAVKGLTRTLELMRIAPKGTAQITDFLNVGADALVKGGELGVFTPMAFFLAQK